MADRSRSVRRLSRYGGVLDIIALCRLPTPTHDTVVGTENSTTSFGRTTLGHRVIRTQNKLIDGMMHANLLSSDTCFVSRDLLSLDIFFINDSLNPDSDIQTGYAPAFSLRSSIHIDPDNQPEPHDS